MIFPKSRCLREVQANDSSTADNNHCSSCSRNGMHSRAPLHNFSLGQGTAEIHKISRKGAALRCYGNACGILLQIRGRYGISPRTSGADSLSTYGRTSSMEKEYAPFHCGRNDMLYAPCSADICLIFPLKIVLFVLNH